jgi:hypothetical protein
MPRSRVSDGMKPVRSMSYSVVRMEIGTAAEDGA